MRSFWSGVIAFGLVTIPTKAYVATRDLTPHFHWLHKECGTPIVTVRRCPKHKRDLSWDEIGKGYEVSKGKFVLFTAEQLAKLEADEESGTIELVEFVDPLEVDAAYVENSYWVAAAGKSTRGYMSFCVGRSTAGKKWASRRFGFALALASLSSGRGDPCSPSTFFVSPKSSFRRTRSRPRVPAARRRPRRVR